VPEITVKRACALIRSIARHDVAKANQPPLIKRWVTSARGIGTDFASRGQAVRGFGWKQATMIIFLNDDRAYLSWVTHHRQGFVLDGRRKPKAGQLLVHRATCREIKSATSPRQHWTTGAKLKACSLNCDELEAWAAEETGKGPQRCACCQPNQDELAVGAVPAHLTRLSSEILDYILDAALIHMENEYPPYRLTVSDIAACFDKTPGQIAPVLRQLITDGLLTAPGKISAVAPLRPQQVVLPTMLALRTLEAFQRESDGAIHNELAKLEVA
jgi:hypothetical protein